MKIEKEISNFESFLLINEEYNNLDENNIKDYDKLSLQVDNEILGKISN